MIEQVVIAIQMESHNNPNPKGEVLPGAFTSVEAAIKFYEENLDYHSFERDITTWGDDQANLQHYKAKWSGFDIFIRFITKEVLA